MSGKKIAIGCAGIAFGLFLLVGVAAVVVVRGAAKSAFGLSSGGPLPADKADYAGTWLGRGYFLRIDPEGTLSYRRVDGESEHSLSGANANFDGPNLVANVLGMHTTFQISQPPAQQNGVWKMTVDGVELTRNAPGNASDVHVNVDCKGVHGGLDCAIQHELGALPVEACFDLTATCASGKTTRAHVCDTVKPTTTVVHHVPTSEFSDFDHCESPKNLTVGQLQLTGVK